MKMKICDVCYYENGNKTIKKSKWRLSIKKNLSGERQAIDACDCHKDYFRGMKYDQAKLKVDTLYGFV